MPILLADSVASSSHLELLKGLNRKKVLLLYVISVCCFIENISFSTYVVEEKKL